LSFIERAEHRMRWARPDASAASLWRLWPLDRPQRSRAPRAGSVALAPRFICCRRVVLGWGCKFVWFFWLPLRSVAHQSVCITDFRAFFAIFLAPSSRVALLARSYVLAEYS